MAERAALPPRFARPSPLGFLAWVVAAGAIGFALRGADVSPAAFVEGLPQMARLIGEMMPPSLVRVEALVGVLAETLAMALAGAAIGIVISLALCFPASGRWAAGRAAYGASRLVIALFRTVPDLVWAVFFVATVGLGPFAGVLTIVVDTIGFCGRFFAESIEETDPGPREALTEAGAGSAAVFLAAALPAALPSFINTSLFAFEKAVRSSVVLGLVGAGGIGIELEVAMDLFRYDEAATIIIGIFVLVMAIEQLSAAIRRRVI